MILASSNTLSNEVNKCYLTVRLLTNCEDSKNLQIQAGTNGLTYFKGTEGSQYVMYGHGSMDLVNVAHPSIES